MILIYKIVVGGQDFMTPISHWIKTNARKTFLRYYIRNHAFIKKGAKKPHHKMMQTKGLASNNAVVIVTMDFVYISLSTHCFCSQFFFLQMFLIKRTFSVPSHFICLGLSTHTIERNSRRLSLRYKFNRWHWNVRYSTGVAYSFPFKWSYKIRSVITIDKRISLCLQRSENNFEMKMKGKTTVKKTKKKA